MRRDTLDHTVKVAFLISMILFDAWAVPHVNPHMFDLPSFSEMMHPTSVSKTSNITF
jgi:hypothetical protein